MKNDSLSKLTNEICLQNSHSFEYYFKLRGYRVHDLNISGSASTCMSQPVFNHLVHKKFGAASCKNMCVEHDTILQGMRV